MPYTALVNGTKTHASDLADDEWADLRLACRKKPDTVLFACGKAGFPRTSRKKNRHFAHKRLSCEFEHKRESAEHDSTCRDLAQLAASLGWSAEREAALKPRFADVLLCRGSEKFVFEVQWSPITPRLMKARAGDYRRHGIPDVWLLRKFPPQVLPKPSIPAAQLIGVPGAWKVNLGHATEMNLADFVGNFLERRLNFESTVAMDAKEVSTTELLAPECTNCRTMNALFRSRTVLVSQSVCGNHFAKGEVSAKLVEPSPDLLTWAKSKVHRDVLFDGVVAATGSIRRNASGQKGACRRCRQRISLRAANVLAHTNQRHVDKGRHVEHGVWHWCGTISDKSCWLAATAISPSLGTSLFGGAGQWTDRRPAAGAPQKGKSGAV